MPNIPHFRFAPSPNYYLHPGHGVSACFNYLLAQQTGGKFILRIEDIDSFRSQEIYIAEIFSDLHWLGIEWNLNICAHENAVRMQSQHLNTYNQAILDLVDYHILYSCHCSRSQLKPYHIYPGFCRQNHVHDQEALQNALMQNHALRIDTQKAMALLNIQGEIMEDYIIRRKDIATSYHIAVIIDDALQNITHIVRGSDLRYLMEFHILLQQLLKLPTPFYWHHNLLTHKNGQKFSKTNRNSIRIQQRPKTYYWQMAHKWLSIYKNDLKWAFHYP